MIRSRLLVTKTTPLAPRGLVTAEHPAGADIGAEILARGGNAVDAAVATAFAMPVVEPFMSTIAGAGTMMVHVAKTGETVCLDFNGNAPMAAHESVYTIIGGIATYALFAWPRVEGDANVYGYKSVAVPGSVAGLALALERYGTMSLKDVVAPAVKLAREGFIADWYQALNTAKYLEELSAFPETARLHLRNGRSVYRPPSMEPGDRVKNPDLAASMELIGREGPDAFYRGALAQAIHNDMAANGGFITKDDLAAYQVRVLEPLRGRYRDLDVAFSPGATGGTTALEILNIMEQFAPAACGYETAAGLHVRAEAVRRAFADRFEYIGDPKVVGDTFQFLASKEHAKSAASDIRRGGKGRGAKAGPSHDCTTHVSVIDRQRNMVSLTNTAVSLWGARVVVPGTGILLNNGMIWFDPEPGRANSIAPGKRGMVNMVPVLGFKKGKPYLALGAPGGRKIIAAIPQVVANLVDTKGTLQQAIDAPRVHHEGSGLEIDDRVGEKNLAALEKKGHEVKRKTETYASLNFARPVGVRVTPKGLEAGLDSFGAAAAAGH
ncbi:MAG: gamma-glutamyltransferase [Candidatus Rokubacteria bacterium]|nr:gamma-glutamyltransferase [Candidatus Rokubacteria bacterium]